MATLAAVEMLDWLGQQQFLTQAQTDELRPLMPGFPDSHAFAKDLILRNWLTPFQVNQLLQGKHDQLVLGAYRLRERLGEGAMGQIFKAWNLRLGRLVAVKTIHKEYISSPKAMDRFRREVETASRLDHPNIALVRDADEADGRPFLVMDFIDGFNLSAHVKQNGALPLHETAEYGRQAALGLQHAFERGIVHRDIKPSNLHVAITKTSGEPAAVVKILDFGLARFASETENSTRLTQIGNLLGTVDYVAPEQAQNARTADIRADIYGLGCSLFYMLTAQPPFLGDSVVEKIGPRLTGDPPSVRAVRPDIPEAFDALLRKLMARRPEDRFQTPIEVAQALQPFAVKPTPPLATIAEVAAAPAIAMAQPVAPAAIVAGGVPMAMPVAGPAAESAPTETEDPSFLAMSATGRDMSTAATAAAPAPQSSKAIPLKLVAILGGGGLVVFFVLCLGLCMLSSFLGGPTEKKGSGTIRITEAKFSMKPPVVKAGERKRILVYIQRSACKEPIKLSLQDLHTDIIGGTGMIAGNVNEGDVTFTIKVGTEPMETPIRVVAENDRGDIPRGNDIDVEDRQVMIADLISFSARAAPRGR